MKIYDKYISKNVILKEIFKKFQISHLIPIKHTDSSKSTINREY